MPGGSCSVGWDCDRSEVGNGCEDDEACEVLIRLGGGEVVDLIE